MLPTALVLGVDTPIGLTVMRELGARGVPVHGVGRTAQALGRASRYCTHFSVRPTGRPLAEWLPSLISESGAAVLLAVSENDLIALADLPQEINGCRIATPRREVLERALDKRRTLDLATSLGIDVPFCWQPLPADDLAERAKQLPYPVVVKWADPNAVLSMLDSHGLAFEKAEFAMDPGMLLTILERYRSLGVWPMVQAYCPGQGLGQMLWMADGGAALRFQHRRLHEWPPEGGVSTLCASVPLSSHQKQMALSEQLLRGMGWHGPAMVEYRHDPVTDRYWLMEVNGRFWGSLPLAWHSGACFAWTSYHMALFGTPPAPVAIQRQRRARYMIPETRRLLRVLAPGFKSIDPMFVRRPFTDLLSWMAGFADPQTRHYVFAWSDPRPFLSDLRQVLGKTVSAIWSKLRR